MADNSVEDPSIETLLSPSYWQELCPELSVNGDTKCITGSETIDAGAVGPLEGLRAQLDQDGYYVLPALNWDVDLDKMVRSVARLRSAGWDPLFLAVYDEAWAMARQLERVIGCTTGGNRLTMDFLAWWVDPREGQAGFSPHRDRQPRGSVRESFRADGSPRYNTVWIPLTDATTANSCLYIIPRGADPGYVEGDRDDVDPMQAAMAEPGGFQNIRALPMSRGQAVVFTHRLIHWGSRGHAAACHEPRVSLAFAASDYAFEAPYLSDAERMLPCPPLAHRVALAASQAINYNKRYGFTASQLALYHRLFAMHAADMDPTYVNKVRCEYQWSRFAHRQAAASVVQTSSKRRKGKGEKKKGEEGENGRVGVRCALWEAVEAGVVTDIGLDALFAA